MKNRISDHLETNFKGDLLIASPLLATKPLAKTVVCMLQDDLNGSFGVVLNRPADANLRKAWLEASGMHQIESGHLLSGGPMGGPVFALHPFEPLAELAVDQGIFLSATAETIDQLVTGQAEPYRICLGVVGWHVGQLQKEIDQQLWYQLPATPDLVFDNSGMLWEKSLLSYGAEKWRQILGLRDLPPCPERN